MSFGIGSGGGTGTGVGTGVFCGGEDDEGSVTMIDVMGPELVFPALSIHWAYQE